MEEVRNPFSREALAGYWNRGFNGAEVLAELREQGFTIRTQRFYDEWRAAVGYAKGAYYAQFQPEDRAPSKTFIHEGSPDQYERYRYVFAIDEVDRKTKKFRSTALTYATSKLVTIEAARSGLEAVLTDRGCRTLKDYTVRAFSGVWDRGE